MTKKKALYTQITLRATNPNGERVTLAEYDDDLKMSEAWEDALVKKCLSLVCKKESDNG